MKRPLWPTSTAPEPRRFPLALALDPVKRVIVNLLGPRQGQAETEDFQTKRYQRTKNIRFPLALALDPVKFPDFWRNTQLYVISKIFVKISTL